MKLLYSTASPFARKVTIVAHETGLIDRIERVAVTVLPTRRHDETHAHNPLGKVPTLLLDDGTALYDSRVIVEYLASLAPSTRLVPEGAARWAAFTQAATADGLMEAAILIRYELLREESHRSAHWVAGQQLKVDQALGALEAGAPAPAAAPSIATVTIAAALGYLDFRFPDAGWRTRCPRLAAFHETFSLRPSMVATRPYVAWSRYDFLSVSHDDTGVTTIVLDRPQVLNALHSPMHEELQRALDAFAADPAQRVCVLTGAGPRAFCAGSDLKIAAAQDSLGTYPKSGYAGIVERFDLDKPVIAAVNGVAMGGGFEIALACDLIIAADTARFGLPEPRVGAVALGGGLHRLARQIGLKAAMGMVLTARTVTAQEGLALGFVNEVVPAADLMPATRRWIDPILACSPVAIAASKQTLLRGLDEASLADAIARQSGYPQFAAWLASDDKREGPRAFAEKRAPRWTS